MLDYYAILEIKSDATQDEIKKAYISLVKKYHPDVTTFDKKYSEEKVKMVNEAYSILSDANKRRDYDKEFFKAKQDIPFSENYRETYQQSAESRRASEEEVVITRVRVVCQQYYEMLKHQIVEKEGFEALNHQICDDLSERFLLIIGKDYEFLVKHKLLHSETAECLMITCWSFAMAYTWSGDYIKAEQYMNRIVAFIKPTSNYYIKFIKDKNNIANRAERQLKLRQENNYFEHRPKDGRKLKGKKKAGYDALFGFSSMLSTFMRDIGSKLIFVFFMFIFLSVISFLGTDVLGSIVKGHNNKPTTSTGTAQIVQTVEPPMESSAQQQQSLTEPITKPEEVKPLVTTLPIGTKAKKNITTGYVKDAQYLNDGGFCRLIIDNSDNENTVYVRLWSLYPPRPVRTFYVAPNESFVLYNLTPATYELRYKYLYEGKEATKGVKSQAFELTQKRIGDSIQYGIGKITLYNVPNGNFRTDVIEADNI